MCVSVIPASVGTARIVKVIQIILYSNYILYMHDYITLHE